MKIYINGGLGNQLFQWAHMHFLSQKLNTLPKIWKDQNPRNDRPFELELLLKTCDHHQGVSSINSGIKPFIRKISKVLPVVRYKSYEILTEDKEFRYLDLSEKVTKQSLVQGYFQNWQYVESVWGVIGDELNEFISNVRIPNLENFSKPIVVLHIRRGDYKLLSSSFGLLDVEYYRDCLNNIRSEISSKPYVVIISDDVDSASQIISSLEPDQILAPKEASAWQCLALMKSASYVVAANSTLSWWGAYLCLKSGGISYIPNPWFKDFFSNEKGSFAQPEFRKMKSSFE